MERRALLKNLALIGLAASLPLKGLLAGQRITPKNHRPFHRFQLGDLELTIVTDGYLLMSPVQPAMAPNVKPDSVKALLEYNFRPTTGVDLGMNILVIRKGQQLMLIDSGTGFAPDGHTGWLPKSLKDAGFATENVTDIILTHGHNDHIGGLLDQQGGFVFPNATLHMAKTEYEYWLSDKVSLTKSKYSDKAMWAKMLTERRNILTAIRSRVQLFDAPAELFGCLRLEPAPGHTPGHTLVHVFSGKEELVHIADMVHSDVLLFPHPEWGFFGDTDFEMAVATRKRVLAVLAEGKKKVFAYHLPWPGMGHVRREGKGFAWVAETYPIPGYGQDHP